VGGGDQCRADNITTENSTAVASSSFQNNEQQTKEESEYSASQVMEHQQNFIQAPDHIYNTHQQKATFQIQYNDQYFPSYQNNKQDQGSSNHKNADIWSDIFRFNRDEFPLEKADQQNEYFETSITQNECQNLLNETETNSCAYHLEYERPQLYNTDLQHGEIYQHMDAFSETYNYYRSNHPTSIQSFVDCLPYSETTNLSERQYYQPYLSDINIEGIQQTTFTRNESIQSEQISNNMEYMTVLPNTETFEEEAWQKLDFYSRHDSKAMQETYVNNEESNAYNSDGQTTSNYTVLAHNNRMQPAIHSDSLSRFKGEFLRPHCQSTNNFKQKKVVQLSEEHIKMKPKGSKKEFAGNRRGRSGRGGLQKGKPKRDKPYVCPVCSKSEQYKAVLKRHLELHHGYTNGNSSLK